MTHPDEDAPLIAAALDGSSVAWERLVRRYERRVYNFGLRMTGNPSDAMDLLQDVFLGVYRNLHRFRGDAQFGSWLFRIAHNKAIDLARRKSLFSGHLDIDDPEQVAEPTAPRQWEPDTRVMRSQINEKILAGLAQIPYEQRLVVEMKIYQSLTFDEIAGILEVSENTAKTRFYTALRKLKTLLEPDHVLSQDPVSLD